MISKYLEEKIKDSTMKLKTAAEISKMYYQKPLVITYSGGKDSDVLLYLAMESGIDFEVVNSHTTLDAPETVYHIREVKNELEQKGIKMTIVKPVYRGNPTSMWDLMVKMGIPPSRIQRYCCKILKEISIPDRIIALGIRKEESHNRANRQDFEIRGESKKEGKGYSYQHTVDVFKDAKSVSEELKKPYSEENAYDCTLIKACKTKKSVMVNPIIDWTFEDIWDYIEDRKITYNPLYDRGYKRVGCIGCPMATYKQKQKQFNDYPAYKRNYIAAFDRILADRRKRNKPFIFKNGKECQNGQEMFDWWIEEEKYGKNKNQMTFIISDDNSLSVKASQ